MAGFPTVDSVANAWTVNARGQKLFFQKTAAVASVANTPQTLWTATGMPAAGGYGSLGRANGRVLTKATAGAMPYNNAAALTTMHQLSFGAMSLTTNALGSLLVVDRIADVLLAHAEASGTVTGVTATSRLPAAGGAQLWLEVQTVFSAASNTITFGYTNQAGTSSRTTQNIVTVASAAVGRTVNAAIWQPLQSGDTGIRSLDSVTLAAGTATGQYAAALVRPLCTLPLPVVAQYVERDFVVELPNMEQIYDDSCLQLIYLPTAAVTAVFNGELRIACN